MPSLDNKKDGEGEQSAPTDWEVIIGDLVCHTSITPSEIPYLTFPQIKAYHRSIGRNIPLKTGGTSIFGSPSFPTTNNGDSHQEDVDSFFNGF